MRAVFAYSRESATLLAPPQPFFLALEMEPSDTTRLDGGIPGSSSVWYACVPRVGVGCQWETESGVSESENVSGCLCVCSWSLCVSWDLSKIARYSPMPCFNAQGPPSKWR